MKLRLDLLEHLTDQDILEEVLANIRVYAIMGLYFLPILVSIPLPSREDMRFCKAFQGSVLW